MKFSNLIKYAIVTVAMVLSTNLVNDTSAQNASSIEELMREDVIAVAAADLAKVDLVKVLKWSSETGIVSTEEAADIRLQLRAAQGVIGGLIDSGVERVSVLLRVHDLETYNPIWVASINGKKDVDQAADALKSVIAMLPIPPQVVQVQGNQIIGGPSQEALDVFLASDRSTARQLSSGLATLDRYTAGVLVTGSTQTRRAVRELFPSLPQPFEEASGELFADQADWGGLFIDLPPEIDLKVICQTTDNQSAEALGRLVIATTRYIAKNNSAKMSELFEESNLAKVNKEVTDNQVVVDYQAVLADPKFIEKVVSSFKDLSKPEQQESN